MNIWGFFLALLRDGAGNLAAYLAAHVLLCLLPAFFIAGGLAALVPQESITRYLGPKAPKFVSYPAAALGGFVLAVCSCTIMPLFAGIYRKGAGLGPAITFLFVGPAINILALTYTGVAIGMDIAIARLVLAILFGIGIGLIMALTFGDSRARQPETPFGGHAGIERRVWLFMLLMLAILITGTLQVGLLTDSHFVVTLPLGGVDGLQEGLAQLVPFDATRGEEGVTAQGAALIVLLILIGVCAWLGFNKVDEGYNRWTWTTLGLIALTLLAASARMTPLAGALEVGITGKSIAVALGMGALWLVGKHTFEEFEMQEWLWETWRFIKQIMPLLIVGVFAVGAIRGLIRPEWIQALAGRNTMLANLVGVLFGVFMYFPTLVEVPIAQMFLGLGMHRGPLLAYLMADPELSLQSILITSSVIGKAKTWVYVAWVALFSTLAGLLYGAFADGASLWLLGGYLLAGLGMLSALLWLVGRRQAVNVAAAAARDEGRAGRV